MYEIINNHIVNKETGEIINPKYINYESQQDYEDNEVLPVEPMTAKEFLNDNELEEMLTSTNFIAETKLDGTRATLHLREDGNRLFSRRISKKTNWYAENSDSVPHIRDLETPKEMYGTVIDGEMLIDGKEFKDVSSTLNCNWDKAIERQIELGLITFHAFDIIYYKGIYIAKMPLEKRKKYLSKVIDALGSEYIVDVPYTRNTALVTIDREMILSFLLGDIDEDIYPNLTKFLSRNVNYNMEEFDINDGYGADFNFEAQLDKKTWYEYIIIKGGEGMMLKDINGTYRHTRGREYTKLKKFETWDCVVLDYVESTREYTGKELSTWKYWEGIDPRDNEDKLWFNPHKEEIETYKLKPVTKHYFNNWIGTIKYGVIITNEELEQWKKANPTTKPEIIKRLHDKDVNFTNYLVVGEASGFDEATRETITKNKDKYLGTVIELKAQEVLKTGKLRHPRFMRFRPDKEAEQCIYREHMRR